jgi:sterol 3beta-glucosyltransferase
MSTLKTPFIYNFSPALVPKPLDWHDNIFLSGYWFLDSNKDYEPPAGLREFIDQARRDGKKIAYVGFGSIVVPDAPAVTRAVVAATLAADVRVVLSKGWSDRGASEKDDTVIPPEIFVVPSVDHTWLFPLIDSEPSPISCGPVRVFLSADLSLFCSFPVTLTHGGAGTTGASLRFGLVTAIAPFFGDQVSNLLPPANVTTTL